MESGISALTIFFALALMAQLFSYVRLRCFEGGHEKYVPSKLPTLAARRVVDV